MSIFKIFCCTDDLVGDGAKEVVSAASVSKEETRAVHQGATAPVFPKVAPPEVRIQTFDSAPEKKAEEEEEEQEVRLNEEFMVGVRKTAFLTTTGLQVKQSRFTVEVHQVNAGLIDDWNGKHPKRAVRVGDYLVEVNGVRGPTAQEMLETFQRPVSSRCHH